MSDKDIIKALECCVDADAPCTGCQYDKKEVDYCSDALKDDALSLINRQKAEIERLEAYKYYSVRSIKAEAIKEFAYRLRQRAYKSSDWSRGEHPLVVELEDVEDVLEEMVGNEV